MAFFSSKKQEFDKEKVPKHIAIIMDGNGRWAKNRGLPRSAGHIMGAQTFKKIVRHCEKLGIKYITVYAFSTENWKRPQEEVNALMKLFDDYLEDAFKDFVNENTKLRFIGRKTNLPENIIEKMNKAEKLTENATGTNLNIALNYGGRQEIIDAVRSLVDLCVQNKLKSQDIDENLFSSYLYTKDQPEPDLVIRPSGEKRLSNFLLWQTAYSELWFDNILWPDFNEKHLERAVEDYINRNRRFGGV